MGAGETGHVTGKFDDCNLHAQADAQIGGACGPGVLGGCDHALNAPVAKAAGYQDAVTVGEDVFCIVCGDLFRVHPFDGNDGVVGGPGVEQGFHHREIGIV